MVTHEEIIKTNKTYWNEHADLWFGTTALPQLGVKCPTDDETLNADGELDAKTRKAKMLPLSFCIKARKCE